METSEALKYILTTYSSGRDIMSNKDRIMLQSLNNALFPQHIEVSRNCGACRVRMYNRLNTLKEKIKL